MGINSGFPRCPAAWQRERPYAAYVEEELRGYLECGLLCFGFARALCTGCGQGFVVDFSCKGPGVCPSGNGRHMAQTAAQIVDHVIPPSPVRQWVISVPGRLRGMLADRPAGKRADDPIGNALAFEKGSHELHQLRGAELTARHG